MLMRAVSLHKYLYGNIKIWTFGSKNQRETWQNLISNGSPKALVTASDIEFTGKSFYFLHL